MERKFKKNDHFDDIEDTLKSFSSIKSQIFQIGF